MLNPNLHLDASILGDDYQKVPVRNGFGEGLVEAGRADERVVGLCCDLTDSTRMKGFADAFPERFVQVGVAEQNLASVASGMAAMGKVPFASSYAMFNPGRNWEQIRTTICYNDVPVKIVGSHAGVSVGPDGGTHQAIEDIAITRVIPNMHVVVPVDSEQAKKATMAIAQTDSPTYIRLAREKTPVMTTADTPFELGKAQEVFRSTENEITLGVVSAGPVLANCIQAADKLDEEGVGVVVLNLHTIKPIDSDALVNLAKEAGQILTVEEHQRAGGIGSAVAEVLVEIHPVPMHIHGIDDKFGESGTPEELLAKHGMDTDGVLTAAHKLLK